jgi:hypothetical protein
MPKASSHENRKIASVWKKENRLRKDKNMNFLLQPKKYKSLMTDKGSIAIMDKTIAFFEKMGKTRLLDDYNKKLWYREFVDFIGKEQIFAKLLTPKQYAGGDPDARWDTARNSEYSELLAFYGLGYWYCFQVTILGLGPIWMSPNETAKKGQSLLSACPREPTAPTSTLWRQR